MISKKICMLGAFSVGKTSLVEQYVHSIFSDKYLSTVGVKISKKVETVNGQDITLVLWDMEGQDIYADVSLSYLRGCMGFFVVADGTRLESLEVALTIRDWALGALQKDVPHYLLLNKSDLKESWEVTDDMLEPLQAKGIKIIPTSARLNENVDCAFTALAQDMLSRK